MQKKMNTLEGKDIEMIYTEYENIIVIDTDNKKYYLLPSELKKVLKTLNFTVEKKRTRTWLKSKY
jgi:hypothetical protein